MTNQISPDTQYVLDAFLGDAEDTGLQMDDLRENLAKGLRATASRLRLNPEDSSPLGTLMSCQDQIFAIADELEG